jgi:hypothetical protein
MRIYVALLVQNDNTFVEEVLKRILLILTLALKTRISAMRSFTAELRKEDSMEVLQKLRCHRSDSACDKVLRILHLLDL